MGAKEDLIAKLKNKVVEEMNEAQRAGEQHLLFATHLPALYTSLESALDGIPNLTITREKISTDMDASYDSLVIRFIGKTVRLDPCQRGQDYGLLAKNSHIVDIFFTPDEDGSWVAMPRMDRPTLLTGDLVIERLSALVDEDDDPSIKLWD